MIVYAATVAMHIPPMPDQVQDVLDQALSYITPGIGILACYCDIDYLFVLFGVILAVDAGVLIYKLVMWVLKKIPAAGIE